MQELNYSVLQSSLEPAELAHDLAKITKNTQLPSFECFKNLYLRDALQQVKDDLTSEIISLHLHDFKERKTANGIWSSLLEQKLQQYPISLNTQEAQPGQSSHMLKLIDIGNQLVGLDLDHFEGMFRQTPQDQVFFDSFIA
jgi:hypothetical protein